MLMDGKKVALEIETLLKDIIAKSSTKPTLGILLVGDDPASVSYVKRKQDFGARIGVDVLVVNLGGDSTLEEVGVATKKLCETSTGCIVQLPLPNNLSSEKILELIPVGKDVDALTEGAITKFEDNEAGAIVSPVALAIRALLSSYKVEVSGKTIAMIGRGKLVGEPVSLLLERMGAKILFADKDTKDVGEVTRNADIVVSGAGVPNLVTKEMIKDGAVVLDAGTSEASGKLVGDVEKNVEEKASLFAPVPGGIGPVTVAMLFVNLFVLAGLVDLETILKEIRAQ